MDDMNIVVDGIMTEYVAEGRGKLVLFLHGWGSNTGSFRGLYDELKKKYRVIGLNFPGFGGTGEPDAVWDLDRYIEFTAKFIEKLKLKNVYAIVGHSFGGRVMLKGCATDKIESEKLIFLDTAGIKPKRTAKLKIYKSMAKVGRVVSVLPMIGGYSKLLKKRLYKSAGTTDYVNASDMMREIFKKVIDEDLKKYIAEIKQSSLVVWGADDRETPVSDAYEFKNIKDSRVHILNGAGHYVFLDKPEKTLELMKNFLKK
jgi:Predicted hydrolases or acyltransferases (alpha/beta hydrolase superfamily)